MDARVSYLSAKAKQLDDFLEFHTRRIQPGIVKSNCLIYVYDLPPETGPGLYNHFLLDTDIYKEDFGTYLVLLDHLKNFSTNNIDEADYVLFPFNMHFHSRLPHIPLKEKVKEARKIAGAKKIIFFSFSDFCMKPVTRTTLIEKQLLENIPHDHFFPDWVEPDDIFIHFESAQDFIPTDIPVFPLVQLDPVQPSAHDRKWLFSFVGEYYKEDWPEGFVRSPSNKKIWEELAGGLIMTTKQASEQFPDNPFFEIPMSSVFTLCPRGIACWSFRLYEAILCGSIPVILSDSYYKPFSNIIPWDSFTITIPENKLPEIGTILQNIPPGKISYMSEQLAANQHWFTANGLTRLISTELESRVLAFI